MPGSIDGRLTVALLEEALTSLNEILGAGNKRLTIALLGGAALALVHRARNSTHDVDVWADDPHILSETGREVARQRSLPRDWINDEATRFLPRIATRFVPWRNWSNLTILTARPHVLLAMKLEASRVRDFKDIVWLGQHLSLESIDQAITIHEAIYGFPLSLEKQDILRASFRNGLRLPP